MDLDSPRIAAVTLALSVGVLGACTDPDPALSDDGPTASTSEGASGGAARAGIPVLLFHQVCDDTCPPGSTYGISRTELARTLAMVHDEGFVTVSVEEYVAGLAGTRASTDPRAPILVTFDDGRLDAYRGADPILASLGARATQFVIVDKQEARDPGFMSWADVEEAHRSGRWDIQLHAHRGHQRIPVRPASGVAGVAPFFANRRFAPDTFETDDHLEPFVAWHERVERDLDEGEALLTAHLPGYRGRTFAVPFGDYGQFEARSNDTRIAPELRASLGARYAAWFTQPTPDPEFSRATPTHELPRFTIHEGDTAEVVQDWLRRHRAPSSR